MAIYFPNWDYTAPCYGLYMPVRKAPKSYRNVTGVAPSSKAIAEAQFESTWERGFLALLGFSPEVVRFEVQPARIEWLNDTGAPLSHTPDVLVEFDPDLEREPWLCEVKHSPRRAHSIMRRTISRR